MAVELEFSPPGSQIDAQYTKLMMCLQKDFREVCHPKMLFAGGGD